MENKPNVAGSGPAWLFDIDSLSQTMNYHPVLAKNQTNSHAGFQGTEKAEEEGTQTYVLFLVLSDGSTNPKNNKDAHTDGKEHNDDIQKSVSPDIHSSSFGDQAREQECLNNISNGVNAAGTLVFTAGLNFTNSTNDFSAAGPSNAAMPNLEDFSHNADDAGAEADINNMESIISSPSSLKDPSWIEAMQEELLQFKMQKVWILVDMPYGKRAIGTKWVYRNQKDERGIVIRNKARLVAQGHTQKEGIDYEEVKQKKDGIFISQDKYVAEILRKFGLSEGKSASTLIDAEKPLLKDSDGKDVDVHTY
nr:ribonuclease H-like domain-containing protein [Tanacetum cinerariifolium]